MVDDWEGAGGSGGSGSNWEGVGGSGGSGLDNWEGGDGGSDSLVLDRFPDLYGDHIFTVLLLVKSENHDSRLWIVISNPSLSNSQVSVQRY